MEISLTEALKKGLQALKAGKAQDAAQCYLTIMKANPEDPNTIHNMGVLAFGVGKVSDALHFFETALKANPKITQYWLSYIDTLIKIDRVDDAKTVFNLAKSTGANRDTIDQMKQRLNRIGIALDVNTDFRVSQEPSIGELQDLIDLHTQGQFQKTLTQGSRLLRKFPKSANLYNIIGAASKGLGKLETALEAYKKAILFQPDFAEAYYNMGNTLRDQGKPEEAIEIYKKTLSIKPDYVETYNNMGTTLRDQGKLEEALEAYKKALFLNPDYIDLYNNMGVLLQEQGKLKEALEAYKKALSIKPNHVEIYNNMGTALRDQGKPEEALEAYKKALSIKPDYAGAYYNMGNTLYDKGKLDDAIEAYENTLSIKPNYADAHNNMGVALKDQGKLKEAIKAYEKALSIRPDYVDAQNNIGVALKDQGKLKEAIKAYEKALSIKPNSAKAYNNLSAALQQQGNLEEAVEACNHALTINPDYAEAYYNLGNALKRITFTKPNRELQNTISSLLNKRSYVRPRDVAGAAISLLKLETTLRKHLNLTDFEVKQSLLGIVEDLNKLPLLLKLMSVCPISDIELEKLLRKLRCSILLNISDIKVASSGLLNFQSALALQCFTNEYIYSHTEEEEKILESLEASVKRHLANNDQAHPQVVLALASYKALNCYEWCHLVTVTEHTQEVFTRQVEEPLKEKELKPHLPTLRKISDIVSLKVQRQYEENPFPRWINLGLDSKPMSVSKVADELNLNLPYNEITKVKKPDILIAGCGTGQHSIESAKRFASSKVLAIDLSISSLAYAKRKTEELGIQNIEYMQADILDLGQLNRQFDIIESAGVLHHLGNPMVGWKVLTDCLRPGGLMKIGLYSKLARQNITQIRKEIDQLGIGSNSHEIKLFRDIIMKSKKKHYKEVLSTSDFYSSSEFRDFLFHTIEYRFNISEIKKHLDTLDLQFCGFEENEIVSHFKLNNIEKDDSYDLDKWQIYEQANPRAFAEMYQFWCQKTK